MMSNSSLDDNRLTRLIPNNIPYHQELKILVSQLILLYPDTSTSNYSLDTHVPLTEQYSFLNNLGKNLHSELNWPTLEKCKEVIKFIRRQGKTTTYPIPIVLAEFYQAKYHSIDQYYVFLSSLLQMTYLLTDLDDEHFQKMAQFSVRIRKGLNPKNKEEYKLLHDFMSIHHPYTTLENIFNYLKSLEKKIKLKIKFEDDRDLKKFLDKINELRRPYEVVLKQKPFYNKNRHSHANSIDDIVFKNKIELNENEIFTLLQPNFSIDEEISHNNINNKENLADENVPKLLDNNFNPKKTLAKSSELQEYAMRFAIKHIQKNNFNFPSSCRLLPFLSYQLIFKYLFENLQCKENSESSECQLAYAVIFISLLSGRSIDNVIFELQEIPSQRQWLHCTNNIMYIYNQINVTRYNKEEIANYRLTKKSSISITLPLFLCNKGLDKKRTINIKLVDDLIKEIKTKLHFPLFSKQHIQNALYIIIKNYLYQPLHAEILTGVDVNHDASLYYSTVLDLDLYDTYKQSIEFLIERIPEQDKKSILNSLNNEKLIGKRNVYIGSSIPLRIDACISLFKSLKNEIELYNNLNSSNKDSYINNLLSQFNLYTLWMWNILSILTGIRPVNDMPGYLDQFDLENKIAWISDKEQRFLKTQGRPIPLCHFLISAISNYLQYLRSFTFKYNIWAENHKKSFDYENIKNFNKPFLLIYSEKKGFIPATPSKIRNLYPKKSLFEHKDNWLRHQLRSLLTDNSYFTHPNKEVFIRALFAHEENAQEIFHPLSSFSLNEYKNELIFTLDHIAKSVLKLEQVKVILK